MKIIVVDDEQLALKRVERLLRTLGYSDITTFSDAAKALEAIEQTHFDVALLDINMPQSNGIELGYEMRYLRADLAIIYQTAHEEHALKAFDIGAVGYLVKPFGGDELAATMQRIRQSVSVEHDMRFLSKNGESYYLLKPDEVFYIQADLSEVILRSKEGFSYYSEKISELEQRLIAHDFFRVHRSYLINLNKIKDITTIEQSKLRFTFEGIRDEVDSSKDAAKLFRNNFAHMFQ